ncbi:MAG: TetR/AcrR family transcriptional regulator [Acidobacteria bacterium]|nr:TetR/AcrR family transcriptional regulator [Acidobacteriota bacterium]
MSSPLKIARAPGRPRDVEAEARILQAALRLLSEQGYARMSLDAVAEEAGVSKPTIYRRWSSKADLATAALGTIETSELVVATGSTVGDLTAALQNFSRSLLRPNGMSLIGTVLAEEAHTPELLAMFRERLVANRRAQLLGILRQAQRGGELRAGVSLDAAVNLLVGAYYARYLASSTIPPGFARELVEVVWKGLAK